MSDYEAEGDWHLDMVSTGSENKVRAWLTYYADETPRWHWQETFPEYDMPERAPAPYDRDRVLQALYYDQSAPT